MAMVNMVDLDNGNWAIVNLGIDNGNWAIVNLGIDYGNWAIVNLGIDYGNWAIVKFWFPTLRSHLSPEKPISMHEPEFRL